MPLLPDSGKSQDYGRHGVESEYFGNSAGFWPGLQTDFDIEEEISTKGTMLKSIKR
jgi:hypothetical protein